MSKVVRSSKYRHVFGTSAKKEHCYDGVKPSRSAWDSNKVAASNKFIGCIWEASGGGSFAVLDVEKKGKLGEFPKVTGHSGEVLDIEFSPSNDSIVGSCSEDGYAKVWKIPDGGLKENMREAAQVLSGHKRKVGTLNWNPTASNVLATSSADYTVKVWDVESGQVKNDISGHSDLIPSATWDFVGNSIFTACKDKKVRMIDPRANAVTNEWEAHSGLKGMRVCYLGSKDRLFTFGFSKMSDRQYAIWDPRDTSKALKAENIDTASGLMMPFWQEDNSLLFLAGKGDGNIRYYEIVDESPFIYPLSEYKSSVPQRGLCTVPKLSMDVNSCEVVRMLKLTGNAVEPIHFCVPRKSDIFQDDLYPPTASGEPNISADEFFSGAVVSADQIKKVSMAPGFVAPKAVETDFKTVKVEKKELSTKELHDENEKLHKRVAYLEAELAKKDAHIKELEAK